MDKEKKREIFGKVCKAYNGGIIIALQVIQEEMNKMEVLDKELLNDLMQIVIAEYFEIEEDFEMLREKYNYSIFDQFEEEDREEDK